MRIAGLLLAASAFLVSPAANAQAPAYKPMPLPLPGKLTLAVAQPYTAQLRDHSFSGEVINGAVTWTCAKGVCRTQATWSTPTVAACTALAATAGELLRFGNARAGLDQNGLADCNRGSTRPLVRLPAPVLVSPAPRLSSGDSAALFDALRRKRELAESSPAAADAARSRPPQAGSIRHAQGADCDDSRAEVNPSASETCDNLDNDCDGAVDEGQTLLFFLDADGDGHGDPARSLEACPNEQTVAARSGRWLVLVGNDCNDADPSRWTGCP